MLKETRLALRITTAAYDAEIASLIMAGVMDLETAGVILPGAVSLKVDEETGEVTDRSTLKDELVKRAIITYVRMNFGSPNDYDRLRDAYSMQKVQLMHATDYTNYDR